MKWLVLLGIILCHLVACSNERPTNNQLVDSTFIIPDTNDIPSDAFGESVKLGRNLMLHTALLIGPNGSMGQYLGNKMNCTNCHQEAGTKPFAFNLMRSHQRYPQYRPREDRVLTLADRVNNCIERPHIGKPLPYNSNEMIAFLSYFKWINSYVYKLDSFPGEKNLSLTYPNKPASVELGKQLYVAKCSSCHGKNGEGVMEPSNQFYMYPPLWGNFAYQPGSSMHRVTMMAAWLKANMPHLIAKYNEPVLSDEEALNLAAFINDGRLHPRKNPDSMDYPNPKTKPFDYPFGPYADTFSEEQHRLGPFEPILFYHKKHLNK